MSSLYYTSHPASHMTLIDISDVWARPGMMRSHFTFSGIPEMYRLHLCVELSFDPSGRFMEIFLLAS